MNVFLSALLLALALMGLSAPAGAHVTVAPKEVPAGSVDEIAFRCPDERANSATIKLVVQLPQDYPFASVKVEPIPGWTSSVTMRKLDAPLETGHGRVVAAVDTISWQGGTIAPGKHQDFTIRAGPFPATAAHLIFKAVQTYDNGEVVRWIQLRNAGEAEPPYPAPVLDVR